MQHKWNLLPGSDAETIAGAQLAKELRLSPVCGRLLLRRGITTKEAAENFFRPSLSDLHDPFLMNDMDKAVERLNQAFGRKEKILVYGDYDVDGTTAVALVYKCLRMMGCSERYLNYYIPDRYDEGYGVSDQGIAYAAEWGAKVVVALDCGIKAIERIGYAKRIGIDFIICDHHNPDDILPDAVAVLDAKRTDNTYPFEHLSGCGVGFKLMQAFAINNGYPVSDLYRHLDLLALSIASDIVPVTGENRILAYYGLKRINRNPSMGLRTIIAASGLENKSINMSDIVFKIGPRINASGRMMNGREAVDLLLVQDRDTARRRNASIDAHNNQRRELDTIITAEAVQLIDANPEQLQHKIVVLYRPDWHKGIVGIVASRLAERYNRPTIILTRSGDHIGGSARSAAGFDVYRAIESCKDLLVNFGGHTYAAGLTIREEDIDTFTERIYQYADETIEEIRLRPQIDIDAEIDLAEINPKLLRDIKRMSPFGPDNEKPVFLARNLYDAGDSRPVGKASGHLKLEITDSTHSIVPVNGIAFNQSDRIDDIKNGPFSACFTIEENVFRGSSSIQLMIIETASQQSNQ